MNADDALAARFEEARDQLRSVAYRLLGSTTDAEDALQEAWLRLSRTGAENIDNLRGWLTTVVARVCLDMLRSRTSRREDPLDGDAPVLAMDGSAPDPERDALLGESVGLALLIVLDRLTPAERVAFVLHDMFDLPFDEIATILARSPAAARKLASRGRQRVRGAIVPEPAARARKRELVEAFLTAARSGDLAALLAILDPDIVLRADDAAVRMSAARGAAAPPLVPEVHGAGIVADTFAGRAKAARHALVDGDVGLVWAPDGIPRVVFRFTVSEDRIVTMDLIADADRIAAMDIALEEVVS